MSTRTVTIHHVHAALRGAQRQGIDVAPLLQKAGISPLLLVDERARVTPEQHTRLIQELRNATDDEFLGLSAVPSRPGTFAMMCHTLMTCADLGSALRRATRFYALFPYRVNFGFDQDHGDPRLHVEVDQAEDLDHFLAECVLVVAHRLSSWLIGRRVPLLRAEFSYPAPAHLAEYELLFGCPTAFDQPRTEIVFARRFLAAPVIQGERTLRTFLQNYPAGVLTRLDYGVGVDEQVRRVLSHGLRESRSGLDPLPGLKEVAERLTMSPATLRRRLQQENTSFQHLKDEVRRDAAITSLVETDEPITELAPRLGFSESTAFHRAFRRWTGTTPGAYRATEQQLSG